MDLPIEAITGKAVLISLGIVLAVAGMFGIARAVFRPRRRKHEPQHGLERTSRFAAPLADRQLADADAWGSLPDPAAERALDVRLRKARKLPWQDPYDAPWDRP